jgi:phosphatidylserine decarboxylase
VDGRISQYGKISDNLLLQAKGRQFAVSDLLGVTGEQARIFNKGRFVTIYLAPNDYHRIHMPTDGQLRQMTFIPGRLFSVSPATARAVRNLYARNERVVFHFDSDCGPVALVLVGAMNVGSIETVHEGVIAPGGRQLRQWHYDPPESFERGQELARFNLGSTAIVLLSDRGPELAGSLETEATLRVGATIARNQSSDSR